MLRRAPNKGSSFSTKLEREICNFYNGDNSKIIFYGGIEL
nr:MAG TPA: zinc finger protein [Caudoviricetes sp.]